jgi:hydrogenase maturation protease
MGRVLILGVGNILHKDDGLGVHIVNHLRDSGTELPDDVEIVDGGTAGYDLIPIMHGYEKVIIVDALRVDDAPGSIYRFTPEHLAKTKITLSLHEIGIRRIIDTMRVMGEVPYIEIIGVVPEDIDTLDIGISDSVRGSIPRVVEQILDAAAL